MELNGPASTMKSDDSIRQEMKEFYGQLVQKSADLQSNVCTARAGDVPLYVKQAIDNVHPEITARYYGCGMVIPTCLEAARVLDLGCGAGQDCYVLSQLVGQDGLVTGLDMTEEQLAIARQYLDHHTEKFSLSKPNVEFKLGYIEKMKEVGIEDQVYDVIVSNCVVNMCADKRQVYKETFRVLKEGGEFFFSDVYADREVSDAVKNDATLWGEGISGALCWREFYQIAQEMGFSPPRLVRSRSYYLKDPQLQKQIGEAKFIAGTYRIFRLPESKEESCYATYRGGVTSQEDRFILDRNTCFKKGEPTAVDPVVASILKSSRFKHHFEFAPIGKDAMVDPFCYIEECG